MNGFRIFTNANSLGRVENIHSYPLVYFLREKVLVMRQS